MTLPTKGAKLNKYAMINQGMVAISTCLKDGGSLDNWDDLVLYFYLFTYLFIR